MTRTWLFQANPKRFDLQGFLASGVTEIEWLVSRYSDKITPGDRVFLWRSGASASFPAGVYAEAEVTSLVRTIPDDGPAALWSDPSEAAIARPRVRISLKRAANKKEVIKRDWWKEDPILRDHLIMRMATHTTFAVEEPFQSRLMQLWTKTGSDWTYADALGGLFAFVETHGKPLSRLPGSPVANASLLVGRAVSGIYNKVMNFRSLDLTDHRKGFSGASEQDKAVWAKFYDPTTGLDFEAVRQEFARLWLPTSPVVEAPVDREKFDADVERLARELTLEQLLARWAERKAKRPAKPRVNFGRTRIFDRDEVVSAIARSRSGLLCEVPNCTVPLFEDKDGIRFVEVHHIDRLADGGEDTPDNVVCLCPLHHRETHHGKGAAALTELLRQVRTTS